MFSFPTKPLEYYMVTPLNVIIFFSKKKRIERTEPKLFFFTVYKFATLKKGNGSEHSYRSRGTFQGGNHNEHLSWDFVPQT